MKMVYNGVKVTLKGDGTAFCDYPNREDVVQKVMWRFPNSTKVLKSDKKRFRAFYKKNELGKLFTDVEYVAK